MKRKKKSNNRDSDPEQNGMNKKRYLRLFFGLLSVYLLVAALHWASGGISVWGDGVGYHQLAHNMYEGKGFSRSDSAPYLPDSIRTPVYPVFILAFLGLFGKSAHVFIIIFAQCVLASLTILLLLKLLDLINKGRNSNFSLVAVIIVSISPTYLQLIIMFYSEILLLFFMAAFLLFLFDFDLNPKSTKKKEIGRLSILGLLLGIMALTKPIMQFFPFLVSGYLFLRKKFFAGLVVFIVFLLTITPWIIRNYNVVHRIELSSIGAYTFFTFGTRKIVSEEELMRYKQQKPPIAEEREPEILSRSIGNKNFTFDQAKRAREVSMSILKDHWKKYMIKVAKNLVTFPFFRGYNIVTSTFHLDNKYYQSLPFKKKIKDFKFLMILGGAAWELIYRMIFYFIVAVGIINVLLFRSERPKLIYLFLLAISSYFILLTAAFISLFDFPRLILPANLGFAALLGSGLHFIWKRGRSPKCYPYE